VAVGIRGAACAQGAGATEVSFTHAADTVCVLAALSSVGISLTGVVNARVARAVAVRRTTRACVAGKTDGVAACTLAVCSRRTELTDGGFVTTACNAAFAKA